MDPDPASLTATVSAVDTSMISVGISGAGQAVILPFVKRAVERCSEGAERDQTPKPDNQLARIHRICSDSRNDRNNSNSDARAEVLAGDLLDRSASRLHVENFSFSRRTANADVRFRGVGATPWWNSRGANRASFVSLASFHITQQTVKAGAAIGGNQMLLTGLEALTSGHDLQVVADLRTWADKYLRGIIQISLIAFQQSNPFLNGDSRFPEMISLKRVGKSSFEWSAEVTPAIHPDTFGSRVRIGGPV